ncbi:MAG: hypothetical protein R3C61_26725 [Bacteroidia bacterium]
MKRQIRFLPILIFLVVAILTTYCAQQPGQLPAAKNSNPNIVSCPEGSGTSDLCNAVVSQINAYKDSVSRLRVSINSGDSILNEILSLKGYQFSLTEVGDMVDLARQRGDTSIYVMFAINRQAESVQHRKDLNSPIIYLDAYLQIKGENDGPGSTLITTQHVKPLNLDEYSDFPQPCPPSCPSEL